MNKLQKHVVAAALCLLPTLSFSQDISINTTSQTIDSSSSVILQKKWFSVNEENIRYNFRIQLSKDESLTVRFNKLSDWTSTADFLDMFGSVNKAVASYKIAIQEEIYTQTLDVYIPASKRNIITRFNEVNESGNMLTIDAEGASKLKLGIDTLRVLYAKNTDTKIQYVFLLKKMNNYIEYAQNKDWQINTALKIDSIVNEYRAKWKHPNASRHGLDITINPTTNTHRTSQLWSLTNSTISLEGSMGATLVRNTFCPTLDYGLSYYFGKNNYRKTFIKASISSFVRFAEISTDRYKAYNNSFVNIEIGGESSKKDPNSRFYKSSLGLGYKLLEKKGEDRDPTMSKQMYRLFFHYYVNNYLVITPEFATSFKKSERDRGWFGVGVALQVF